MLENDVLAFYQASRAAGVQAQSGVFRGKIVYNMRPESPLRQRNVKLRDIYNFVFLDNLGREEMRKVMVIQRSYRIRRFFLPLFSLMQSARRRQFYFFIYLYNLSRGYRKTLCHRETKLKRRCIEGIAKLARRRYKAWMAERFLKLTALRRIFKRMMAMYYQQARLLKLLRYYYKKYARRLCGWVFSFLFYKQNFIVSLRHCDSCDLEALCDVDSAAFKRNYLIDNHLFFVGQKLAYIRSLKVILFRETLLRVSFVKWLNLRRYKVVSFRARVQMFARSLHCIFDKWQNESSGRHALLRYSYIKLRTYCLSGEAADDEKRAGAFQRRFKLAYGFAYLKKNRVLTRDLRFLSAALGQQKSGLMEFIMRSLIYLERGEIVFVGQTLQKAAFCIHDGEVHALMPDFDYVDYKKQSCNRTLFRTYNEEFCIKYKVILRLKELAAVRKAFLRLGVLVGAMCNLARLHASIQCWKQFVRDYKYTETSLKTTRFSDYSDFRGFLFEFLARQEMWTLLRRLAHVGNKTALMIQISATTPYFCAYLFQVVYGMSKVRLDRSVEKLTSYGRFAALERYLLFNTVIFGLRPVLFERKATILQRTIAEQDEMFNLHALNMRKIVYRCDFEDFIGFYRDLLEYQSARLTNILQNTDQFCDLKRKAVIGNSKNAATFSQLKAFALKSVREDTNFYERVRYITPLLGYVSALDFMSTGVEECSWKQPIVPCEKLSRMELYGESFPAYFVYLGLFPFYTQQGLSTLLAEHMIYPVISYFAEAVVGISIYSNERSQLVQSAFAQTTSQGVGKSAKREKIQEKQKEKEKTLTQLARLQKTMSQEGARLAAFNNAVEASARVSGIDLSKYHTLYVSDCYLYNLQAKTQNSKPAGQLCLQYAWDFPSLTLSQQKQKSSIGRNIGGQQAPSPEKRKYAKYDYFAVDERDGADNSDNGLDPSREARELGDFPRRRAVNKSKKPASRTFAKYAGDAAAIRNSAFNNTVGPKGSALQGERRNSKAAGPTREKGVSSAKGARSLTFVTELKDKNESERAARYAIDTAARVGAASDRHGNSRSDKAKEPQASTQEAFPRNDSPALKRTLSDKKALGVLAQYNYQGYRTKAQDSQNAYRTVASIVIPAALPRAVNSECETAPAQSKLRESKQNVQSARSARKSAQDVASEAAILCRLQNNEEAGFSAEVSAGGTSAVSFLPAGLSATNLSSTNLLAGDCKSDKDFSALEPDSRAYSTRKLSGDRFRSYSEGCSEPRARSDDFLQTSSFVGSEDAITQEEYSFSRLQKKPYCGEFESDGNEHLDLERIEREVSREFACELSDRYRNKVLSSPGFADFAKKNIAQIKRQYEQKMEFLANDQFMDIDKLENEDTARTKLDYSRLERILEARKAKKQTLQYQFEERYVDSLIREKLAIQREYRPLDFMYVGYKPPAAPSKQDYSIAGEKAEKDQQQRAELQQNSAIYVSELLSSMRTLRERREQQRIAVQRQNEKRVEIISLMLSRCTRTSIDDLARQAPRVFYRNRRDPGRLTASVTIRAVSPAGCVESAAVEYPKKGLAFASRRGCDGFMYELAGLRSPQLFALFRQFRWRRHIFTPAVHNQIVDEAALRKRVVEFSQRYQRMTFTYLLKALSGIDFSRQMATTVVTRYVDGAFQYQEITLGFDVPYKPVDVDSLLILLAKKGRADSQSKKSLRVRGNDVYYAIDYYYLSAVGKPVGKCRK